MTLDNKEEQEIAFQAINTLAAFLASFSGRTATRDRLHIFTTNYDRFIELGCDVAGIKIIDRFWGKVLPRFQEGPSTLDYYYRTPDSKNEFRYAEGIVRYSKIHGSVDWYEENGTVYKDALRFGADNNDMLYHDDYKNHVMIYPNSMKSVETAFYPYAELFRDFGTALCMPNSTLFSYGYGFGDTHINKIIQEMLSIPSTHLVIVSYDANERLTKFLKGVNLSQVTLLIGSEFGNLQKLVDYYLPTTSMETFSADAAKILDSRKAYTEEAEKTSGEVKPEIMEEDHD